jgi:hypothetical protein
MTRSKTAANVAHGAPAPNEEPAMDGAPPASESDRISSKAKLMAELVTERKRVYSLNMELVKKLNDNAVSVSKFQSTITARDRSIANKEVEIAEQKSVVETYKAKLGAKEASHRSKILQLGSEQDAALAVLNNQLESNRRENKGDKAKSLNVGRELSSTTDRLKKLKSDVIKLRSDYDELANQHRESKSENSRMKKELTIVRKKVFDQMELTLAHKERMKDKEIERERIRFDKAKDNNYTKLLAEERKHLNIQERVDNRYEKADSANEKKHTRKTTTDRENVGTAVARAAQAAMNVQMASNDGSFPNPRGVDLQRVSSSYFRHHYYCKHSF